MSAHIQLNRGGRQTYHPYQSQVEGGINENRPTYQKQRPQQNSISSRQTYHNRSHHNDAMKNLKPGPLQPGQQRNSHLSYEEKPHNVKCKQFFQQTLQTIDGNVHVIYESVRKFGRFEMLDGNISNKDSKISMEGLSRIWQVGQGYIYVHQTMSKAGERLDNIAVWEVDQDISRQLDSSECQSIISVDPLWEGKRDRLVYL